MGQGGCSRFFMPGMLEVNDPDHLAEKLKALREGLIADLYF